MHEGQRWQTRRRSRRSRVELRFVAPRPPSRSSHRISRGFYDRAGAGAGFSARLAELLKKPVLELLKKPCQTSSYPAGLEGFVRSVGRREGASDQGKAKGETHA